MTIQYCDPIGPPWRLGAIKLMLQWKGSILQLIWIEMLIVTAVAVLFMALWLNRFLNAEELSAFLGSTAVLSYALDYLTQRFQAALGMMLGFYTTIMYNRWWRVRNIENDAMSGIKSCTIYVFSYINSTEDKDHGATGLTRDEIVSSLVRWVNLAHAIAVGEFYEKRKNMFKSLESLVEMGLMTEKEYQCIVQSPVKYDLPCLWFIDLLDKVVRSNDYSIPAPPALAMINSSVTRVRSALDNLHMYRTEPVPLAYRQLVNITVRFYVVILILNEGLSALGLYYEAGYANNANSVFWMTLPFVFEYFLFVGWLTLADALANQFRDWSDAFDWIDYVQRTYIGSFSLIENSMSSASKAGPLTSSDLKKAEKSLAAKRTETMQGWKTDMEFPECDSCMMTWTGFDKCTKV